MLLLDLVAGLRVIMMKGVFLFDVLARFNKELSLLRTKGSLLCDVLVLLLCLDVSFFILIH